MDYQARIDALEARQTARREHIKEIEAVIDRNQLEIDNLRAMQERAEPEAPAPPGLRGLTALP